MTRKRKPKSIYSEYDLGWIAKEPGESLLTRHKRKPKEKPRIPSLRERLLSARKPARYVPDEELERNALCLEWRNFGLRIYHSKGKPWGACFRRINGEACFFLFWEVSESGKPIPAPGCMWNAQDPPARILARAFGFESVPMRKEKQRKPPMLSYDKLLEYIQQQPIA